MIISNKKINVTRDIALGELSTYDFQFGLIYDRNFINFPRIMYKILQYRGELH